MHKHWKLIAVAAVLVFAPVVIWVATMHLGSQDDVEAYKKSLIAKGEKLEIKELLPLPVPPEQNGADLVNEAFGLLGSPYQDWSNLPPAMQMVAPGKALVGFEQPDVRSFNFRYTNSWSNVMDSVEAGRPGTELLRQAMNYPALDFHLDYEQGPETPLPHLPRLRHGAQRLSAEAICDLHEGNAASATTNICAILGLVGAWQEEGILASQLYRIAMTTTAANASWELLQSTNVHDAELAMLQKSWERLEFFHPMGNTFMMQRAASESTIKKMRASNEYFNHVVGAGGGGSVDFWDRVKFASSKMIWQVSWSYSDELGMLQNDQIALETIRTIETNGYFNPAYSNMVNQLQANEPTNDPDSWLSRLDDVGMQRMFSMGSESIGRIFYRMMASEVARRVVITAIALKRYQLKHGNYPTNLDLLVPEFIPVVPLDPVDGKPLRYHPNADGTYLLYSIGRNGLDDGGNPAIKTGSTHTLLDWLNPDALDWVWPQPATAAEIEYYYAHPTRP